MKKILFTSIILLSNLLVKAQTAPFYENLFFNNLYGPLAYNNPVEKPNYHFINTNQGFGGQWGLDIKWWGGIKWKSENGIIHFTGNGNVGINKENPLATLDVNGDIKSSGSITTKDIISSGSNGWIFHTPDDGRTTLYIAPISSSGEGDWGKSTQFNGGNISVNGKLEAKEIKVTLTPTADFVFEENYGLPKLKDVEKFIKENKHLPEIASAKVMEKEGVNVGEFQIKLLQKIEELTLYVIDQQKKIENLESKLSEQTK